MTLFEQLFPSRQALATNRGASQRSRATFAAAKRQAKRDVLQRLLSEFYKPSVLVHDTTARAPNKQNDVASIKMYERASARNALRPGT
jgi:hypothetical protein